MADIGTGEGASVDPVKEDFKTAQRKLDAGDTETARKAVASVATAISGRIENGNSSDDPEAYSLRRVLLSNEALLRGARYLLTPPEQVSTQQRGVGTVYVDIDAHNRMTGVQYLRSNERTNPYYEHATSYTASVLFPRGGEATDVMDTIGGIYDDIAAHGVRTDDFTVVRKGDVENFIDKFPFSRDLEPSSEEELQMQHDAAQARADYGDSALPSATVQPALEQAGRETGYRAVTDRAVEALGTTHEELANFLQSFADVADSTDIGYGNSNDYEMVEYCGPLHEWVRFVDEAGNNQDRYALLRGDMQARRRPQSPDEYYTVVNMRTGDELHFAYSDIEHIRRGDYIRTVPTHEYVYNERYGRIDAVETEGRRSIDPRLIAAVAGITQPYDDNDPITKLTKGRNSPDGVLLDATFQTKDQIDRFTRLFSLNETANVNARVTFAPETVEELHSFVGGYGSEWIASHIQKVVVPEGKAPIILDKEHEHMLGILMDTVGHWDADTQRAIYRSITSIDISALGDDWAQGHNIRNLVQHSIHFADDGSYTVEPSTILTGRLLCNQYDFLEAIYKAADGLYSETMTQKWGEPKATHNAPTERLDEHKAQAYAKIFGWRLMNSVDAAREAYHIPDDIPEEEQIVMLLKNHGYTEKGMRLSKKENILRTHANITVPQWGEICMIIDRCREAPIREEDRATIERFGFEADAIRKYWEMGPGNSSEHIAEYLTRPPRQQS